MSSALTRGIRVTVDSFYLAERSSPSNHQFAFGYKVRIANEGSETSQLRTRHWIITDGDGRIQEVKGEGVVGAQAVLTPGQHFEYTSWCMLPTPHGSMHGTYQMVRPGGERFEIEIAPFALRARYSVH